MKIKQDDQVVVTAGKDKGKKGKVLRVMVKSNRVVVEKINMRTRHLKKSATRAGEIIHYEAPLSASNVMLIDPKSGKATRVGYKKLENGKKIRVAKKSGETLTVTKAKKATTKTAKK
jgi:large subunit ribosomal protein L24